MRDDGFGGNRGGDGFQGKSVENLQSDSISRLVDTRNLLQLEFITLHTQLEDAQFDARTLRAENERLREARDMMTKDDEVLQLRTLLSQAILLLKAAQAECRCYANGRELAPCVLSDKTTAQYQVECIDAFLIQCFGIEDFDTH